MTEMCFLKREPDFLEKDKFDIVGSCTKTNTGIDVLGLRGRNINELLVSFHDFMERMPSKPFKTGDENITSFDLGVGSIVRIDHEQGRVMLDRRDDKGHLVTGWVDVPEEGIVVMPPGKIFTPTHVRHSYISKSHDRVHVYISPVNASID